MWQSVTKKLTSPDFWVGVVVGFGVLVGALKVPGLVVTSEECQACEVARAGCEAALKEIDTNRKLAWERVRECREACP